MHILDLTPFGFTATESRIYGQLLQLGPSTGYSVAQATRVARANTYSALEGLVSRGAAARDAGRPARYRPADPAALLARLATEQAEALDKLAKALENTRHTAEPETRSIGPGRAFANFLLQVVARANQRVQGVLPAELLRQTLPAWRRAHDRAAVELHVSGADLPQDLAAFARPADLPDGFPTLLLIDERQTVAASPASGSDGGFWSSHPAVAAIARLALKALG
jgi:sugar-specific transcriptional regulator TrmB